MLHRKECIASNICVWLLCMYRAPRTLYCMYRGGEAECRTGNGQNSPHSPLLSRIDKSSLGVPRIGVATPWDDCPYAKSNANTFVRARAYRVFLTLCVGMDLGDIHRGLRNPRDVPSVDPSTLRRKTLYELASLKYCYTASSIR